MGMNIIGYGEGCLSPDKITLKNILAIRQAGWTSVALAQFHIAYEDNETTQKGDIIFNKTHIISGGRYIGDSHWPDNLAKLLYRPDNLAKPINDNLPNSKVTTLLACFGPGAYCPTPNMWQYVQDTYSAKHTFEGTQIQTNFQAFYEALPAIRVIDMDIEGSYDCDTYLDGFVAFCQMLIKIGFEITFCPYRNRSFWAALLCQLNAFKPGAVKWCNLQCYDGGNGNDSIINEWANCFSGILGGFDTTGFIIPGDWTNDGPSGVQSMMFRSRVSGEQSVGGGFIWTLDNILSSSNTMSDYIDAIKDSLSGKEASLLSESAK